MPTIYLVGFRGTGGLNNTESPYKHESALIRAGHVAIGGVIPNKLIGFSPTPKAIERAGGEKQLLALLKQNIPQEACLQDDTEIFLRAKQISGTLPRARVWQLAVDVSEEVIAEIKKWYNEGLTADYSFPDASGKCPENTFNCATFPEKLGVSTPSDSGALKIYIAAMRLQPEEKISEWQP